MTRGRPSRQSIYAGLDEAITDLRTRLGGLPTPTEAEDIWDDVGRQEAHHSTALEGNTLVLDQVRKAARRGPRGGLQGATRVHGVIYMEVIGYGEGRQMRVRTGPGPGPRGWTLMTDWVKRVKAMREPTDVAFPERLAEIHNSFERIHPFLDGNGRTGRLLLNLLFVRLGYPPATIFKNEREKYLKAMRRADKGDFGPMGELVARAVTNNLYRFVVPAVAGPARLVPLASLVDEKSGVTVTSLRAAIERGRLRAQKSENGTWLSSKRWVEEYLASRYNRMSTPEV